jgi:hypothetical protein
VAARLIEDPFVEPAASKWDYETAYIERLDELKERLEAGEFLNQVEIADHFGVSPAMAGKYIKKGLAIGLWTKEQVGRWFAKGKGRRTQGTTEAPVRPSMEWTNEDLSDDSPSSFANGLD